VWIYFSKHQGGTEIHQTCSLTLTLKKQHPGKYISIAAATLRNFIASEHVFCNLCAFVMFINFEIKNIVAVHVAKTYKQL